MFTQFLNDLNISTFFAEAGVAENQGWCATKVDTHDDYIPHNWGICQPECKPPVSKCNKYRISEWAEFQVWKFIHLQKFGKAFLPTG